METDLYKKYENARDSQGVDFLFNLMRQSRPYGFMMFSTSFDSPEQYIRSAIRLLLSTSGIDSGYDGEIRENTILYKDAVNFCEYVQYIKDYLDYFSNLRRDGQNIVNGQKIISFNEWKRKAETA